MKGVSSSYPQNDNKPLVISKYTNTQIQILHSEINFKCRKDLILLNLVVKFLPCNELTVFPNFTNRAFHLALVFMQQPLFLQRLFAAARSLLSSIKTGNIQSNYCTQTIITFMLS